MYEYDDDYMEDFNESWEQFRSECIKFARERDETVIKKWLDSIGFTEPVGYYMASWKNKIEIYTTRPGMLIGKAGIHIQEFKRMLAEEYGEYHGEWNVEFVEIKGGFVNV